MNLDSCTQVLDDFICDSSQQMNVVIVQFDEDQKHCGIVYKFDGKCNMLHLAWHHDLRNETDMKDCQDYCCIISQLEEHRQYAICAMCDQIKDDTDIPYGIFYKNSFFTDEGKLQLEDGEVGLTCATFVLAVFKSCQLRLIDMSTWLERDGDSEFHSKILSYLERGVKSGKVLPQHYADVEKDKGCVRFRPEEVAASSGFKIEDMPVSIDKLNVLSSDLKNSLERGYVTS